MHYSFNSYGDAGIVPTSPVSPETVHIYINLRWPDVPVFGDLSLDKADPENVPNFDIEWGEMRRLKVTPVITVAI